MQFDVNETTFFTSEFVKETRIAQSTSDQRFITQETANTFIQTVKEATIASKNADNLSDEELQIIIKELSEQIEHIHTVFELIAIY